MTATVRVALLNVRLVMRTKVALFFTFLFPLVFLFVYAGLFARGNPQAVAYVFGPVVTLNIMGSGFWGLGLQSVVQRERGSLRRYRLAPIGAGTIVASNLLANYLLELPTLGLLVLCAKLIFHMPLSISLLDFLILATVGVFAFAGFGLTIASVANTMQEARIYNNLAWLTLLFLSGATVPLPMLPNWVQSVATFLPATYLVSAFQAVMVQSQPLVHHWPEMLALSTSGTFGLLFAWKLFRWEKEERIPSRRKWWAVGFVIPFLLVGLWMNAFADPRASWAMSYSLLGGEVVASNQRTGISAGTVIEDFETGKEEDLLKRWEVSIKGTALYELSTVRPGAAGSGRALRILGHHVKPVSEHTEMIARCHFTPPPEANAAHGLEFRIRGESRTYQVNLYPVGSMPELHPGIRLLASGKWQLVQIPARWNTGSGPASSTEGSWVLEVVPLGPGEDFSLEIDGISLY